MARSKTIPGIPVQGIASLVVGSNVLVRIHDSHTAHKSVRREVVGTVIYIHPECRFATIATRTHRTTVADRDIHCGHADVFLYDEQVIPGESRETREPMPSTLRVAKHGLVLAGDVCSQISGADFVVIDYLPTGIMLHQARAMRGAVWPIEPTRDGGLVILPDTVSIDARANGYPLGSVLQATWWPWAKAIIATREGMVLHEDRDEHHAV